VTAPATNAGAVATVGRYRSRAPEGLAGSPLRPERPAAQLGAALPSLTHLTIGLKTKTPNIIKSRPFYYYLQGKEKGSKSDPTLM